MAGLFSSGYSSETETGESPQQTSSGLFEPLAAAVYETVTKLVKRNSEKGELKKVTQWATQQINKVVEESVCYAVVRLAEEEKKRKREKEAAEQDELQRNLARMFEQLLQANSNPTSNNVVDHGTEKIVYPWTKNKLLGKGAFGVVYSATDKNGFKFAVKIVDRDEVKQNCLQDEISCLTQLSHENIVKCYGWAEANEHVFMYLELLEGSVRDKLDKQEKPLKLGEAQKYTRQMLQGLVYLHDKDLIHRDIKGGNVLLDKSDNAKLADMGLVKTHEMQTMTMYGGGDGTILYMSPEVLTRTSEAGKRADVWAIGCTVYEMLKFWPPFYTKDQLKLICEIMPQVQQGIPIHKNLIESDPELAGSVGSFLQKIFTKLEDRPYAAGIAQHKWLIDW